MICKVLPPRKYFRHKGDAALAVVIILGVVSSFFAFSAAKVASVSANSLSTQKIALDAREIAFSKAELIKAERYSVLTDEKKTLVANTSFYEEVTISAETSKPGDSTVKQKRCTINVYYGHEPLPRSTLSFYRYSVSDTSSVPSGTILPWYGVLSKIPDGFALCDGQNGTPDLRDRFLVGAGGTYQLGNTGGENSVKLAATQIGNHYHTFGSYSNNNGYFIRLPSYATFPMPPGSGRVWWNGRNGGGGFDGPLATQSLDMVTSLAISTAAQEAHENRPPYYALFFIMKLE